MTDLERQEFFYTKFSPETKARFTREELREAVYQYRWEQGYFPDSLTEAYIRELLEHAKPGWLWLNPL